MIHLLNMGKRSLGWAEGSFVGTWAIFGINALNIYQEFTAFLLDGWVSLSSLMCCWGHKADYIAAMFSIQKKHRSLRLWL